MTHLRVVPSKGVEVGPAEPILVREDEERSGDFEPGAGGELLTGSSKLVRRDVRLTEAVRIDSRLDLRIVHRSVDREDVVAGLRLRPSPRLGQAADFLGVGDLVQVGLLAEQGYSCLEL